MNYEKLRKDYIDITEKWGDPEDMTGGFVDQDSFRKLLKNPTKQEAAKIIKSIIDYGFQKEEGYYNSETDGMIFKDDCPIVGRIYNRYYVDFDF